MGFLSKTQARAVCSIYTGNPREDQRKARLCHLNLNKISIKLSNIQSPIKLSRTISIARVSAATICATLLLYQKLQELQKFQS